MSEEMDDDGMDGKLHNPDSTICLDSTLDSTLDSNLDSTSTSGIEIIEDGSQKKSACDTIELDTTATSEDSFVTVDKVESGKETVDSSAPSDHAVSTSGDENNRAVTSPKRPHLEDMFVIDSAGSEVSKSEEDDSESSPTKKDRVTSLKSPSLESSSVQEISSPDSSPQKEIHGIFPANPFDQDDDIVLDTTESISSQETRDSTGDSSQKRKKIDRTSGSHYRNGKASREETEKDTNFMDTEEFSIDIDGDVDGTTDEDSVAPYPVHEIPRYDTVVSGVLSDVEYSMETGQKIKDARPKKTCFNCQGDHNVPECTEPQNYQRIAANRKKQMSNRISNVRYHEDCENKYGQYQPGKVSEHLREALGLRYGELPIHIYRMRCLGYPPGWLKEAEVKQADVKLYDGTGQSVSHPDNEEGEAEPTLVKYNPDKLVSFPGFNVAVPRGCRDEWRDLNFPPMNRLHRKSEFERYMEQNKAGSYKKRKLKDESLRSDGNKAKEESEMEVDNTEVNSSAEIEFNPPLPDEKPIPPLPAEDTPASPEKPVNMEEGELVEDDSQSSIGYLEAKRKALLEQLDDPEQVSSSESKIESVPAEKENVPAEKESVPEKKESVPEEKESVPEEKESIPEKKKSVPKKKKSVPKKKESVPEKKESVPEKKESVNEEKESIPEEKESIPKKKESVPEKKESVPEKKESVPEKKESVPEKKESVPEKKESVPEKKESVPEKKESVPEKKESVPAEKENLTSSDNENDTESSSQLNEDSENSISTPKGKKEPKVKHHRSHSKGFQLGAAIPDSITPFTILPDAEKWTVDVTDHINFENLPDALGTWDKMKGLVRRVRKRMEVLHDDD